MKDYIIELEDTFVPGKDKMSVAEQKKAVLAFNLAAGAEFKKCLEAFIKASGLEQQVERISRPMAVPYMMIRCTEAVKDKIEQAKLPGVSMIFADGPIEPM